MVRYRPNYCWAKVPDMGRDFTLLGRALAAPARSAMLNVLMDGSTRPAAELAQVGGVSRSAASEHLACLVDSGLVCVSNRGRQRLYALADQDVAAALEQLGYLCLPMTVASLRQSSQQRALAHARLCYDHLAGRLGVAVASAFIASGWLTAPDLHLTAVGHDALIDREIPLDAASKRRRPLTLACPDWTMRRLHLAGFLGAMLATHVLERGWVKRHVTGRGLSITSTGEHRLTADWGVDPAEIQTGT